MNGLEIDGNVVEGNTYFTQKYPVKALPHAQIVLIRHCGEALSHFAR